METIILDAAPRESGKKAAKAARREGTVPCVIYGHGFEARMFQVPELSLRPLIFTDQAHVVNVNLNGDTLACIIKEVQFHPVTDRPLHADFQMLQAGESVTMTVPIHLSGTSKAQVAGGRTEQIISRVEISCLPKDIPAFINIDVTELNIGQSIRVRDLDETGLTFLTNGDQTIVAGMAKRQAIIEEEEMLEEGEEGEGAEDEGEETTEEA